MWSLAMRDPIPRNHIPRTVNYQSAAGGGGTSLGNQNISPQNALKRLAKAPDYCWSFNKGLKCKYGKNCRYIERCSYFDSPVHGITYCPKITGKNDTPQNNNNGYRKPQGTANYAPKAQNATATVTTSVPMQVPTPSSSSVATKTFEKVNHYPFTCDC